MKGNTQHLMVYLVIAIASAGCAKNGSLTEHAAIGPSTDQFDPLALPAERTPREPFLDPLVFFSDRAYLVLPVRLSNGARTDAAYIGGQDELIGHLKARTLEYVTPGIGWLKPPTLHFTVNAEGGTEAVELIATSGNAGLDQLFVTLLEDLPKWTPATDATGKPVAQAFEFSVDRSGC